MDYLQTHMYWPDEVLAVGSLADTGDADNILQVWEVTGKLGTGVLVISDSPLQIQLELLSAGFDLGTAIVHGCLILQAYRHRLVKCVPHCRFVAW